MLSPTKICFIIIFDNIITDKMKTYFVHFNFTHVSVLFNELTILNFGWSTLYAIHMVNMKNYNNFYLSVC